VPPTRSSQGVWDLVTSPARPVDQKANSTVRIMAIMVLCYLAGPIPPTRCQLNSESRIYSDCLGRNVYGRWEEALKRVRMNLNLIV
jgi:hypothetical protein